jgi:hypothetical protein
MTTKHFESGTLRLGTPLMIRGAKLLQRLDRQSAMDLLTAEDPMPHALVIGKEGCDGTSAGPGAASCGEGKLRRDCFNRGIESGLLS